MKLTLTNKIIIGFILGLVLGEFFFLYFAPEVSHDLGAKVQIVSKIFLRLIKMIVGPLVFCTLVVGIAKLGDFKAVGRIGIKTIGYFYFATILSLLTGLVVVNVTQPGSLQSWPKPAAGTETGIDASKAKTMEDFILHIFPDSFFKALAEINYQGPLVLENFSSEITALVGPTSLWRPSKYNSEDLAKGSLLFMRKMVDKWYN